MSIRNGIRNIVQKVRKRKKGRRFRKLYLSLLLAVAAALVVKAGIWASTVSDLYGTCDYDKCAACISGGSGDACIEKWCYGCTTCGFWNPTSPTIASMNVEGADERYTFNWAIDDEKSVWGGVPGQSEFILTVIDPATGKKIFNKDVLSNSTRYSDKALTLRGTYANSVLLPNKTYTWTLRVRDDETAPSTPEAVDCTKWSSSESSSSFATCQRTFVTLEMDPCARGGGTCNPGEYVTFHATTSDNAVGPIYYDWTVNGYSVYSGGYHPEGDDKSSEFTTQLFSTSTIGVSVRDEGNGFAGCNTPYITAVVAAPPSCSLSLDVNPNVYVGETMRAVASGGDGRAPVVYHWYLDDVAYNPSNTFPNESFKFDSPKYHTITVRTDSGCTASRGFFVKDSDPCTARLFTDNKPFTVSSSDSVVKGISERTDKWIIVHSGDFIRFAGNVIGAKDESTGEYTEINNPMFRFVVYKDSPYPGGIQDTWHTGDWSASPPAFFSDASSSAVPYKFSPTFSFTFPTAEYSSTSRREYVAYSIYFFVSRDAEAPCQDEKHILVLPRRPKWNETAPNPIPGLIK